VTKVADILTMEHMSSDESEMDEKTHGVKQYNLRKFTWESRELRRAKRKIDKSHQDSLLGLSKRALIPREQRKPSSTPKPANRPDCAHVFENGAAQVADVATNPPLEGTADNDVQ
jgi:hypothetical protein